MSCKKIVAIIPSKYFDDKFDIVVQDDELLNIPYSDYTYRELVTGRLNYKPPIGKNVGDLYISKMKPIYDILFYYDGEHNTRMHKTLGVLIETEHSFLLEYDCDYIVCNKVDIKYEKTYEQENLDFIDEL